MEAGCSDLGEGKMERVIDDVCASYDLRGHHLEIEVKDLKDLF